MVTYYHEILTVIKLLCIVIGLLIGIHAVGLLNFYLDRIECKELANELINNNTEPTRALLVLKANGCS